MDQVGCQGAFRGQGGGQLVGRGSGGEGGDVKICLCSGGSRITQPTDISWEGLVRETFCTKQLAEPSVGLLVFMK